MKHYTIILLTILSLLTSAQADNNKIYSKISEKQREAAALMTLEATPGVVKVYAKGLCCESCAIGIRKKVHKLKFVDTSKLNKGVDLDARTQLVTIAVRQGEAVDIPALKKAIKEAGYEAIKLYELTADKKLKSAPLNR
ncbi:MAG: heavy-metal-associated domain-containing protein [Luteolibacter sp.]